MLISVCVDLFSEEDQMEGEDRMSRLGMNILEFIVVNLHIHVLRLTVERYFTLCQISITKIGIPGN